MRVDFYTIDCIGEAQVQCLRVQESDMIGGMEWNAFYFSGSIKGFGYEYGLIYNLIVIDTLIKNPPKDSIRYNLRTSK